MVLGSASTSASAFDSAASASAISININQHSQRGLKSAFSAWAQIAFPWPTETNVWPCRRGGMKNFSCKAKHHPSVSCISVLHRCPACCIGELHKCPAWCPFCPISPLPTSLLHDSAPTATSLHSPMVTRPWCQPSALVVTSSSR